MRRRIPLLLLLTCTLPVAVRGQSEPLNESSCVSCHTNSGLWDADRRRLYVDYEAILSDVHWKAGISCHDCHGGDPAALEFPQSHNVERGFQKAPTASEVPTRCAKCHSNQEYMQRHDDRPWVDQVELYWQSVHGNHLRQAGGDRAATCTSCHQVHAMKSAGDAESLVHPTQLAKTCGRCHDEQLVDLRRGVHETAGVADGRGAATLLSCLECHRGNVHGMVPAKAPDSPVVQSSQVQACGSCHEEELATYQISPHAAHPQGASALAATCSECHGTHAIYRAPDRRSMLHSSHVSDTCGRCHE
jgi:nitrate/TMAO reductase-like tetraheme cytochrome c subunit